MKTSESVDVLTFCTNPTGSTRRLEKRVSGPHKLALLALSEMGKGD